MKTPNLDVDPFVDALRGDLPSAADEARVRARLLAAGVVVTSAALSTSSAASSAVLSTSSVSSFGAAASTGAGVSGASAGLGAAAPVALVKAGLLSKVLLLPVAAKVGMAATLAVAVAATSVPLVLEHRELGQSETAASEVRADRAAATAADERAAQVLPALERAPGLDELEGLHGLEGGRVEAPALDQAPPADGTRTASAPAGKSALAAPAPSPPAVALKAVASKAVASKAAASTGAPSIVRASRESPQTKSADAARGSAGERQAPALSGGAVGGRTELVRASSLGEETRLMEQAMVALGEGDRALAQRSLEEHARRFPGGLLQRERERALARLRQAAVEPAKQPATDSSR